MKIITRPSVTFDQIPVEHRSANGNVVQITNHLGNPKWNDIIIEGQLTVGVRYNRIESNGVVAEGVRPIEDLGNNQFRCKIDHAVVKG